jgi:hypothetical protein
MNKHNLEWYKERIGKRVYRTESSCQCEVCKKVGEIGLIISDNLHAQYLYDCQNELDLYYFDEKSNQKQQIIDIMKADEDNGLYNQNK